MPKYQAKQLPFEAMQLTKDNRKDFVKFVGEANVQEVPWDPVNVHLKRGITITTIPIGSWVAKRESDFSIYGDAEFKAAFERAL